MVTGAGRVVTILFALSDMFHNTWSGEDETVDTDQSEEVVTNTAVHECLNEAIDTTKLETGVVSAASVS